MPHPLSQVGMTIRCHARADRRLSAIRAPARGSLADV